MRGFLGLWFRTQYISKICKRREGKLIRRIYIARCFYRKTEIVARL